MRCNWALPQQAVQTNCCGIDADVTLVDCFLLHPLCKCHGCHCHTLLFLVEQCHRGSSTQTAFMGCHNCNSLVAPHMLVFCLSKHKELKPIEQWHHPDKCHKQLALALIDAVITLVECFLPIAYTLQKALSHMSFLWSKAAVLLYAC